MKHLHIILTTLLALVCAGGVAHAQKISDSSYRTVQDGSYRTIGYAKGIPMQWAAFYFFFGN